MDLSFMKWIYSHLHQMDLPFCRILHLNFYGLVQFFFWILGSLDVISFYLNYSFNLWYVIPDLQICSCSLCFFFSFFFADLRIMGLGFQEALSVWMFQVAPKFYPFFMIFIFPHLLLILCFLIVFVLIQCDSELKLQLRFFSCASIRHGWTERYETNMWDNNC